MLDFGPMVVCFNSIKNYCFSKTHSFVPFLSFICIVLLNSSEKTMGAFIGTEGHKGIIRTVSGETYGPATLIVDLGMHYAYDKTYMRNIKLGKKSYADTYTRMLDGVLNIGLGATSFMDLSLHMPLFFDLSSVNDKRDAGIGDLALSAKFLYPLPSKRRLFYQSGLVRITLPTGTRSAGLFPRYSCFETSDPKDTSFMTDTRFYTQSVFTLTPMIAWTFDFGAVAEKFPVKFHTNVGTCISLDDGKYNNYVTINSALEVIPIEVLTLFVEMNLDLRWYNFEHSLLWGSDPFYLTPGIALNTPSGLYVKFAGDFGLLGDKNFENWKPKHLSFSEDGAKANWTYSTKAAPKWGMQLVVGWEAKLFHLDKDKDRVKDNVDRCPEEAEDIDKFEDSDGCPDLDNDKDGIPDTDDKCSMQPEDMDDFEDEDGCPDLDNDQDGILDAQDRCPKVPEDMDGLNDEDGCPEGDNDRDGIVDTVDQCLNEAEDIDGHMDDDGCPDPDNDNDGILDVKDRCPNEPEDIDGYEDEDGCADRDNDNDGILDADDQCPKDAEVINGIDDTDGCPDKKSDMAKFQIIEGVQFKSGSAELTFSSYQFINPIVEEMKSYSEIVIEIRGHTDNTGGMERNMELSVLRAEAIRDYMYQQGITEGRIKVRGYGPNQPLISNGTREGRARNRRIEIVRIK